MGWVEVAYQAWHNPVKGAMFMYSGCIHLETGANMVEIITSRASEELVRKLDKAVSSGHFRSRSEALRLIIEQYFLEHPELLIGDHITQLLSKAPILSDEELENMGSRLFKGVSVSKLVAEGRR